MIRIRLTVADVTRIRFGFSPLAETVLSLRALANGSTFHAPWTAMVRDRLDAENVGFLQNLVRPAGYIPDFLVPPPEAGAGSAFDVELKRMRTIDPDLAASQLGHLETHDLAQRGPQRDARTALIRVLTKDPERAVARIADELHIYWQAAVEPYWPRIRALLQADLAYRLEELAEGGVRQLFSTLHPLVTHRGEHIDVAKYWDGTVELGMRGLLLVPCVFAWPDVLVRSADPYPTMSYSPRGLGRLWETNNDHGRGLKELIGRSRAAVLAQLDLPITTTQLACLLDLTAPTLSVHLKTLEAAGVVTSRRDGRAVFYRRTELGDRLLKP